MNQIIKIQSEVPAKTRSLGGCAWYWVEKDILFAYGSKLKAPGIAVYNVLAAYANSKTQTCFPTHALIAKICGVSTRSVIRKIKLLEEFGLIRIEKRRRARTYCLLAHRIRDKNYSTGDKSNNQYVTNVHTNNNKVTRIKNENAIMNLKDLKPTTREELLAQDLAIAMNDRNGLPFYLAVAKVYPEGLLRAIAAQVKQIPDKDITKSRGALFNHLLKKYAQQTRHNSGN